MRILIFVKNKLISVKPLKESIFYENLLFKCALI